MATPDALERLHLHQPVLKYDSQECYFADSAAIWVECPGNVLSRDGKEKIDNASAGGELSLNFLGASYGDGKRALPGDYVSDPSREYRAQAHDLHLQAEYRNRAYGRVTPDERWLQYWFFYFYNDYNLVGHLLGAGRHEGDWEMVQIHLDESGAPDQAVYAQHAHAHAKPWRQVELAPETERPLVYVARGSHAAYFKPGTHWTGNWFDHADGQRRSPDQELLVVAEGDDEWRWLKWPGHWGDTKPKDLPVDSSSPTGPGAHSQWSDPESLLGGEPVGRPAVARPEPPAAPQIAAKFDGEAIRVDYRLPSGGEELKGLAITVNTPDEPTPPSTYQVEAEGPSGSVVVPASVSPSKRYDLHVSQASTTGLASESVRFDLPPERAS